MSDLAEALVRLTFAVHEALTRVSAEHDLSVTQLRLLGILRDRTPPMTALAERLGLDRSSVTGLIDRAERRGLVARTSSPDDARVVIVHATAQGRQIAQQLSTMVNAEIDRLVGRVAKADQDSIRRLVASMEDRLARPEGAEPARPS
jgi:DNA-binding MarR family transcriptional regulator